MSSRFVCVLNRNRDAYQVPLALAEAGLLEAFVTDYYAPEQAPAWLPGFLARRRIDGIARSDAVLARQSFVLQYAAEALRLPMRKVFPLTDRLLARKAGAVARRSGQGVYAYHNYVPDNLPDGAPLVLFVFHPLPGRELPILEADAAQFPESAAMIGAAREDLQGAHRGAIDWGRADAVVCASSFTASSVIEDGCPAEKIAILPYGLPDSVAPGPDAFAPRPEGREARFLFVGQGVVRKGLHHLIRAWQASPPANARLDIVSYRIDPEIAALIEHPSINLLGYQSRADLQRLMGEADVFAMPSLVEGFGLVYLEALSNGCHVLGTANSGLPDLSLSDGALTLVEPGDLNALQGVLATLSERSRAGQFDRRAIADAASVWTQTHFRKAIAEHAANVLVKRAGSPGRKGG